MSLYAWWWVALVGALCIFMLWRYGHARALERGSRPCALRDAELAYMETEFRIQQPIALVARVDRAYCKPDGTLVLVELKTRWGGPQRSDIIQLSAQRLAIVQQTGRHVATHGYVVVEEPGLNRPQRWHRVELLDAERVVTLAHRRLAILTRRLQGESAQNARSCHRCAYLGDCDRHR